MANLIKYLYGKFMCSIGFHLGWVRGSGQVVCIRPSCEYHYSKDPKKVFKDNF